MDVSTVTTLITSVGFPIVCCLAMGWYVKDQTDKHRADIKALQDEHSSEMKEVTTALNNNTIAIEKLCASLGKEKE